VRGGLAGWYTPQPPDDGRYGIGDAGDLALGAIALITEATR
jgi:hypothetical protein